MPYPAGPFLEEQRQRHGVILVRTHRDAVHTGLAEDPLPGLGLRLHGAAMDGSVPVTRLGVDEPLCLLLGNEQRGLSKAARGACSTLFHVPMVGMSESLNLSVTAAISLFEVLRRKRESGSLGDLDQAGRARLRACYYAVGVDDRLVHALFGSSAVEASP